MPLRILLLPLLALTAGLAIIVAGLTADDHDQMVRTAGAGTVAVLLTLPILGAAFHRAHHYALNAERASAYTAGYREALADMANGLLDPRPGGTPQPGDTSSDTSDQTASWVLPFVPRQPARHPTKACTESLRRTS